MCQRSNRRSQVAIRAPLRRASSRKRSCFLFDDGATQPPAANGATARAAIFGRVHRDSSRPRSRLRSNRCCHSTSSSVVASLPAAARGSFTKPCRSIGTRSSPEKPIKQLQQLLPKKTVNEYIRDGKPATADDDPVRVVGFDENGKPLPPGDISKAPRNCISAGCEITRPSSTNWRAAASPC